MKYVTFSIIIDDIVFHDGHTEMGMLGGGGPQAAFGMRLWSESVGIVAGIGSDFRPNIVDWFKQSDIDQSGLHLSNFPTTRAWQVLEDDGRRTQVWRVPGVVIQNHLRQDVDQIPTHYRSACGYHIGIHALEADLNFLSELHNLGGLVSVELFKPAERLLSSRELEIMLKNIDIFSPNLIEAKSILGDLEPLIIINTLLSAGANIIALRMGNQGSLVASCQNPHSILHIPVVPINPVNFVGAGNAYCGGFLVGWAETHDLSSAGLYGAVSASFLLENLKIPIITSDTIIDAHQRFTTIQPLIQTISVH